MNQSRFYLLLIVAPVPVPGVVFMCMAVTTALGIAPLNMGIGR